MELTNEEFGKYLDAVYMYMKPILMEKNKSYGSASFAGDPEFAISGNCHRQCDKINRYKSLITKMMKGESPEALGESMTDTLSDLLGYAMIGLIIWNQKEHFLPELPKDVENVGDVMFNYYYNEYRKSSSGNPVHLQEETTACKKPFSFDEE